MFCPRCGARAVDEKMKFCQKCGAPLLSAAAPSSAPEQPPIEPQAAPAIPAPSAPASTAKSSNTLIKVVVAILGLFAVGTVLVLGTCVYLGYKVKHKVAEVAQQGPKDQPADQHAQVDTDDISLYETRPITDCDDKDQTGFDDYRKAAASASIPLKNGLTLVSIWTDPSDQLREVEVLLTVKDIQGSTVEVSQQRTEPGAMPDSRTVCVADLLRGRSYESDAGPDTPETIPGTTMFSLSRPVFDELKAGKPVNWTYDTTWNRNNQFVSDPQRGVLTRIEPEDVPYSVIVNDKRTDLPAIHARATLTEHVGHKDHEYEAWFLDDPANPITLNIVDKARSWRITYVKISFPVEEKKIEQDLAQNGRAEIYGIYFDSGSATLRPESAPVLKEISDALAANPSWKIRIEGHTDNRGGDAYNLGLSQKRAEAVKAELESQYQVGEDRMSTQGFGGSRPKATNDTMEGRALNRRVELVRE